MKREDFSSGEEYLAYRVRQRKYKNRYRRRLKRKVLAYYSRGIPTCANCGNTYIEFLQLDHVDGNGEEHRNQLGGTRSKGNRWTSWRIYALVKKQSYPEDYQTLCQGCNQRKRA